MPAQHRASLRACLVVTDLVQDASIFALEIGLKQWDQKTLLPAEIEGGIKINNHTCAFPAQYIKTTHFHLSSIYKDNSN